MFDALASQMHNAAKIESTDSAFSDDDASTDSSSQTPSVLAQQPYSLHINFQYNLKLCRNTQQFNFQPANLVYKNTQPYHSYYNAYNNNYNQSKSTSPVMNSTNSPIEFLDKNLLATSSSLLRLGNNKPRDKKRIAQPVPNEVKDSSYWSKRIKNNESAKRSREAKRYKEEQVIMRVINLEKENLQLRAEFGMLNAEIEKLRFMQNNMHIQ